MPCANRGATPLTAAGPGMSPRAVTLNTSGGALTLPASTSCRGLDLGVSSERRGRAVLAEVAGHAVGTAAPYDPDPCPGLAALASLTGGCVRSTRAPGSRN